MQFGNTVFADVVVAGTRLRLVVTLEITSLWEVQAIDVLRGKVAWKNANLPTKDVARSTARDWAEQKFGNVELEWKKGAGSTTA